MFLSVDGTDSVDQSLDPTKYIQKKIRHFQRSPEERRGFVDAFDLDRQQLRRWGDNVGRRAR